MKIYLDTCCWGRKWDDHQQERMKMEARAVKVILDACRKNGHSIVGSMAVEFEILKNPKSAISVTGGFTMSTATATQSPAERRKVGIEALTAALGSDGTAAFLGDLLSAAGDGDDDYAGIPGWNYTAWRKENPQPTFEEIGEGILRLQAERKGTGT